MTSDMTINWITRVCHEAVRAWTMQHSDQLILPWDDTPEEECEGERAAVRFILEHDHVTAAFLHGTWKSQGEQDGWTWGPERSNSYKQDPGMVDWYGLPGWLKHKFELLVAIVKALSS